MTHSPKFDLHRLDRWLVHWNLISAVSVDDWFTLNLIARTLVDRQFTEIWSRPPNSTAGSLNLNLNLCWWLVHWNLISTTLVEGWFTEIWSRLSWSMSGSLKFDLGRFGPWLVHWNLISTTPVDDWFIEIWSWPSWSIAGSHLTWYRPL